MLQHIQRMFHAVIRRLSALGEWVARCCAAALAWLLKPIYRMILKAMRGGNRAAERLVHAFRRTRYIAKRYGASRALRLTAYSLDQLIRRRRESIKHGFFRLAPMALAAVILIVAVQYWTTFTLAYEVNYDGNNLGYVASEAVFEDACELVSDRVVEDSFAAKDNVVYSLAIVAADEVNDANEICENIIRVSDEIQTGVGLYVDGRLVTVCSDGAAIEDAMSELVAGYSRANTKETLSITNTVAYIGGLYPAYKIRSAVDKETLKKAVTVAVVRTETYTEDIPFEIEQVNDPDHYIGFESVVKAGTVGKTKVVADVSYVNGKEVDRKILSETELSKPAKQIVAVGTKRYSRTDAADSGETLLWPVVGSDASDISSCFGDSRSGGRSHKGTDILSPKGTPIVAAEDGVVTEIGGGGGYGNYLVVQHEGGLSTLYSHCDTISAEMGQQVKRGDYLASVGITGWASAYHCHFEVRVNDVAVDARPYLGVAID